MAADVLATQGARASAAMVLTYLTRIGTRSAVSKGFYFQCSCAGIAMPLPFKIICLYDKAETPFPRETTCGKIVRAILIFCETTNDEMSKKNYLYSYSGKM